MKALIKVGYGCNNHCTFCHTFDVRDVEGSTREVDEKIDRAARLGHTMIVLSGGEVTMRPELLRWATKTAALGLDFGLVTNGRLLAYREVLDRLVASRLRYVYMSMHGGDAKLHNLLVRADAFEQTYAAVKNLSGRGLDVTVNTVVTRQNVKHLRGVVEAMAPYPDVVLKFSMVQPKGGADHGFSRIVPRVAEVAEKVLDAVGHGRAITNGAGRYAHDGIPLCLLPGLEAAYDDLKTHGFATMTEVGEADFFPVDDRDKVHPAPCAGCSLRGPCPGLYRGYAEIHGTDEVRAVRDRARSNSFTYVFERVVGRWSEGCPVLRTGTAPFDRGRHLFVMRDDAVGAYRTSSRDFADREIEEIKHDRGQVYLDVSGKAAPDDFARDLRQLRRSPRCEGCAAHATCAGIFEPTGENAFARDGEVLAGLLRALEGRVLDVGCGDAIYAPVLAPMAAEGRIAWVGVDPSERALESLRARAPAADLRVGSGEALERVLGDDERFDHALVVRSWNHLVDPRGVIASILRRVRAGGTLIVVDDGAFGVVRGRAHAERAERSSAEFEHHRNDLAGDAVLALEGLALTLLERHDVGPGTSNQWILCYRIGVSAA